MYEHNGFGLMFDKGQKQSSTLSCDSSYHSVSLCQQNTMEEAILNSDVIYSV